MRAALTSVFDMVADLCSHHRRPFDYFRNICIIFSHAAFSVRHEFIPLSTGSELRRGKNDYPHINQIAL